MLENQTSVEKNIAILKDVIRLDELIRDFPEYKNEIQVIISRIKDLIIPFQKKFYYKPGDLIQ